VENDESLKVYGRSEGVHFEAGTDGMPVADICRKAGISQATYFNWKKKYDGLLPNEMRRLKQLEDENGKLLKVVADLSLDKEMLQDALRRKI
jgi:putative transposase